MHSTKVKPGATIIHRATQRGHHGELLQGTFLTERGDRTPGLITIPGSPFRTRVSFASNGESNEPLILNGIGPKATAAVKAFEAQFGRLSGKLQRESNIPPGIGCGSSTADIYAVLSALEQSILGDSCKLTASTIAQICLQAESACDPIMWEKEVVLFDPTRAVVLAQLARSFPPIVLLGFASGNSVETDQFERPCHTEGEIVEFATLRERAQIALQEANLPVLGEIATRSASINQRYLPKPHFDAALAIAAEYRALGIQVAHSGSVIGIMFSPDAPNLDERLEAAAAALKQLNISETWTFETGFNSNS